jgi:ABC-type multidrug transport system ATPase subunit
MGVCPQFDTLWLDLTCEETLLFYARLKGVAGKDESEHTMQSLNMVRTRQTSWHRRHAPIQAQSNLLAGCVA